MQEVRATQTGATSMAKLVGHCAVLQAPDFDGRQPTTLPFSPLAAHHSSAPPSRPLAPKSSTAAASSAACVERMRAPKMRRSGRPAMPWPSSLGTSLKRAADGRQSIHIGRQVQQLACANTAAQTPRELCSSTTTTSGGSGRLGLGAPHQLPLAGGGLP